MHAVMPLSEVVLMDCTSTDGYGDYTKKIECIKGGLKILKCVLMLTVWSVS